MPTARPADDAAIREQAYYFWEQDGKPAGRETEYWMRALVALTDKSQLDNLTAPPPKKKAAASKSKAAPAKAEAVKKPKKK
ncbi:MAG: DUF2934 domain-containing protein [Devosia sp.]